MKTLALLMMVSGAALAQHASSSKAGGDHRHDKFSDGQKAFEQARAILQKEYAETVSDDDVWRSAVAGLMSAGGRQWDALLSPADMAALKDDMAGQLVGIGVEIDHMPSDK